MKERTLVESSMIPRLLYSVSRLIVVSFTRAFELFHRVAKSTLDSVIVIKMIRIVILLRYTRFKGVYRSPKLFLKSFTTRLKAMEVVLDAIDDTDA